MTVGTIGPESQLSFVRGVVNTVSPGTILAGQGFTITRNGTGDVTVNFNANTFSAAPTVLIGTGSVSGVLSKLTSAEPTSSSARALCESAITGTAADGKFHFLAIGPP